MTRSSSSQLTARLGAELVVIVAGVLIALWVDAWADRRGDAEAEHELLLLIEDELERHLSDYQWILESNERRRGDLEVVAAGLAPASSRTDTLDFLQAAALSTNFGWGQPEVERAAFDGLVASGRLSLIADESIRTRIVSYYTQTQQAHERMLHRRTGYAPLVYGAIPVDAGLELRDETDLAGTWDRWRDSGASELVVAEMNRTIFMSQVFELMRDRAEELAGEIRATLEDAS